MNRLFAFTLFLLWIPFWSGAQSGKMVITNSTGVTLTEEPVILSRLALAQFVDIPNSNGKFLLLRQNGKEIPSQLDDLDRDGQWDELAFQLTLERNSQVEIKLKWVEKEELPNFPRRVQAFLGVSEKRDGNYESRTMEFCPENLIPGEQPPRYHMDGPIWENDKVGFRYFLDPRNVADVFGKTTATLKLDSIGLSNTHFTRKQAWGMRILDAESGLGIGGLALVEKNVPNPIRKTEPTQYFLLANGPCRAVFDLISENWEVNGTKYQLRQKISIWAGKYGYQNEILLSGYVGIKTLAVGLGGPKIMEQATYKTLNPLFSTLFLHGPQSENKDMLGLGIMFSGKAYDGYGETEKYDHVPQSLDSLHNSHFVQLKVKSGQPVTVYVFAGWEKSEPKFSNARYFLDSIQEEADRKEVVLKFSNK